MRHKCLIPAMAVLAALTCCAIFAEDATESEVRLVKQVHPTLTSGMLASARLADLPKGTVLRSGDLAITVKDLDAAIAKESEPIRTQLKKNTFFLLESKATRDLILKEAKKWAVDSGNKSDLSDDVLLKSYLDSLTADLKVTDQELNEFYDQNKTMLGGATFDQVKTAIAKFVLDEKKNEAIDKHVAGLGERHVIEVDKTWTAQQNTLAMDNPIDKARQSGKHTLVDFGGVGCACSALEPVLEAIKTDYAGKANVVSINVQENQVLTARYGVQSVPVLIFFDKDGKEVFRHNGLLTKEQIVSKFVEIGVK